MSIYFFGCGLLGLVAGILVGGSASPVVGVVLPLLFTILGGGAGLLGIITENPRSERAITKFKILGSASAFICIPFLIGSIYGSMIRTGDELASYIPSFKKEGQKFLISDLDLKKIGSHEAFRVLLIDSNLRRIGVSSEDTRKLIENAISSRKLSIRKYASFRKQIFDKALQYRSSLSSDRISTSTYFVHAYLTSVEIGGPIIASEIAAFEKLKNYLSKSYSTSNYGLTEIGMELAIMANRVPNLSLINPSFEQMVLDSLPLGNSNEAQRLAGTKPPTWAKGPNFLKPNPS